MDTSRLLAAVAATALLLAGCGDDEAAPTVEADLAASASAVDDAASASVSASPTVESSPSGSESDAASSGRDEPADASSDEGTTDGSTDDATAGEDDGDGDGCAIGEDEAGIEVLAPADGEAVTAPFSLEVCGNTFEGTFVYEVVLADGSVAGGGFGTMDCGSGCVGAATQTVEASGSGEATLRVFEEDAASGDRVNLVEVPIRLGG